MAKELGVPVSDAWSDIVPVSDNKIHLTFLGDFVQTLVIWEAEEPGGIYLFREYTFEVGRQAEVPNVSSLVFLDL